MGVSCPNETKCLYKMLPSGFSMKKNIYAEFQPKYFDQGTFRYCYLGIIKDMDGDKITTTDFPSGQCVVKVYKNGNFTQDFFLDFAASQYAYEKAIEFNKIIGIPNKINFILPYSGSVHLLAGFKLFGLFKVTDDDSEKYISPNMRVAIEPFLDGKYTKFSSNTGYENPDFNAYIPAFSHYTWLTSKGTRIILDVQGIFKNNKYYLTDPACQSIDQIFGNSDLGALGLSKFIICHKHNDICKNWKWIPSNLEGILRKYHTTCLKRTSFSFENRKTIEKYKPLYNTLLKSMKF